MVLKGNVVQAEAELRQSESEWGGVGERGRANGLEDGWGLLKGGLKQQAESGRGEQIYSSL